MTAKADAQLAAADAKKARTEARVADKASKLAAAAESCGKKGCKTGRSCTESWRQISPS